MPRKRRHGETKTDGVPPTEERLKTALNDNALRTRTVVEAGKAAKVFVVEGTLQMLWRRRSISRDQYDAGKEFETEFRVARLDGVKLQQWEHRSPSADRFAGEALMEARDYVAWAMRRLGGFNTMLASVVWQVLGLQKSLRDCVTTVECERARRGMLIAALDVLAKAGEERRRQERLALRGADKELQRRAEAARYQ